MINILPLTRVEVEDNVIRLKYFFPFRPDKQFAISEIEYYQPMQAKFLKREVLMGCLVKIKDDHGYMILKNSVDNFEEMHELLMGILPVREVNRDDDQG